MNIKSKIFCEYFINNAPRPNTPRPHLPPPGKSRHPRNSLLLALNY